MPDTSTAFDAAVSPPKSEPRSAPPKRHIAPEEMRRRLINATIGCLVEHGYASTTTQKVQERAGVSRGALLHHFPTKSVMFLAAVQQLAHDQGDELRAVAAAGPPNSDRLHFAVTQLRQTMSGPLYVAGYELWMAARTDETLREILAPYERGVGQQLRELAVELFGPELAALPGFSIAFESLLQMLRGLALADILRSNPDVEGQLLSAWVVAFPALCEGAAP